jgi:hypothetical protein
MLIAPSAATATTVAATATTVAATAFAATATATATATVAAAATTRSLLWWARFVDCQITALNRFTVQCGDCCLSLLVSAHFHKAKSFGAASVTIHDHLSGSHCTVSGEQILQVTIANIIAQVANIQFLTQFTSSSVGFWQNSCIRHASAGPINLVSHEPDAESMIWLPDALK